jgi:hypothetical protein
VWSALLPQGRPSNNQDPKSLPTGNTDSLRWAIVTKISKVDRWFEELDNPLADALQLARRIILGADDRVTETIKWSTPTFVYKGNIVSFAPSKQGVSLMFHRGAEIPGDHPRLEGDNRLVRTMRFANIDEVEGGRKDIESAISAWCNWRDTAG